MLEDQLKELNANIVKLIAVMGSGKAAPAAATTSEKAGKTAAAGPKLTFEMVKAAVVKVKDEAGKPAAQKIIKEVGKASELQAIKPAQFAAVIAACDELLAELVPEEGEEEAEEDSL